MTNAVKAEPFLIGEAIEYGWNKTKDNFLLLCGAVVCTIVIPLIPAFTANQISHSGDNGFILGGLLSSIAWIFQEVLQTVMGLGLIKITLNVCDNKDKDFSTLFSCYPLFFFYLLGSIIYGAITGIGFILLIVPGIIWGIQFEFFGFFMVDKNMGPIESLKASSQATRGVKWKIFLFGLALLLLNVLGLLCLGVGLLVTLAISLAATAYVFRKLEARDAEPVVTASAEQTT